MMAAAYTPDTAWTYTSGRLWLEIIPGGAAVLGGLILLASALRPTAMFGAGLAAAGGAVCHRHAASPA
jgi:hypothetical protein